GAGREDVAQRLARQRLRRSSRARGQQVHARLALGEVALDPGSTHVVDVAVEERDHRVIVEAIHGYMRSWGRLPEQVTAALVLSVSVCPPAKPRRCLPISCNQGALYRYRGQPLREPKQP